MGERIARLLLGVALLGFLSLKIPYLIYGFIALVVFEGLTNLRISRLVAGGAATTAEGDASRFSFEADRAMRLSMGALLAVAVFAFPKELWWFPWFAGFMLLMAGFSGICPMVLVLRKAGFR